jgi:hypothetical protein
MPEKFEPYLPMDSVVSDEPPPEDDPPIRGPLSLQALLDESARLFKRHWFWCSALFFVPHFAEQVELLLSSVGGGGTFYEIGEYSVSLLVSAPLSIGAGGAVYWRLLGSAAYGPVRHGPLSSTFHGLRFFVPLFVVGLVLVGALIVVSVLPIVLYVTLITVDDSLVPSASSLGEWLALGAATCLSLVLMLIVYSRLAVAVPIAIAEDRPVGTSIKMSSSLVKGRSGTVLAFVVLVASVGFVAPMLVGYLVMSHSVDIVGPLASPPAWLLWVIPVQLVLNIFTSVVSSCGIAALYKLLRATASTPPAEIDSSSSGPTPGS